MSVRRASPVTRLFLAALALLACGAVLDARAQVTGEGAGTTYYVRTDGGTASQCTGLADAAYPGSGTKQACAWATPMIGFAAMPGGNTLRIQNGSYAHAANPVAWPSGTANNPTRIRGEQAGACTRAPEIYGTNGIAYVMLGDGAQNVELECLEITDHSPCAFGHYDSAKGCGSSTTHARDGIRGWNMANIVLRDVNIHGLAKNCMQVSKVANLTLERSRLVGCGDAGFNPDTANTTDESFSGTILFKQVEIAWNGCTENYPSLALHACYNEIGGGYGDGIGSTATGGNWIIEDSVIHHNTSDGLDLRYTKLPVATVEIRRSIFRGNAGNQVKVWGKLLMESSLAVSDCTYFGTRYGTAINPKNGATETTPESCRADGNTVFVVPPAIVGVGVTIRNSTIAGESAALIQTNAEAGATASSIVRLENNVLVGAPAFNGTGLPRALSNGGGVTVQWQGNTVWNTSGGCPAGQDCSSPQLRNMTMTGFDGRPLPGSPVVGAADTSLPIPALDAARRLRPAAASRGAFEP